MGFEPTHIGITIRGLDHLTTDTIKGSAWKINIQAQHKRQHTYGPIGQYCKIVATLAWIYHLGSHTGQSWQSYQCAGRKNKNTVWLVQQKITLYRLTILKHTQLSALDSLLLLGACSNVLQYGATRRIRTSRPCVRSTVLYPNELWSRVEFVKVVPPSLLTPFTCLYKVDQDSVRHLGY